MNRVVFAITTCFLVSTAQAYQFEVKGQYGESIDEPRGYEAEQTQASLVWWLEDVSTKNGPLAEAGFLSRTSSLAVNFGRVETEFEPPSALLPFFAAFAQETENDRYGGTFSWIHDSGWILRAQVARTETDQSPGSFGDVDGDEYGVNLGYYLTNSTTIEASYVQGDSEGGSRTQGTCPVLPLLFICIESSSIQFDTEVDTAALAVKHVGAVLGQDFAINFQYAYIDADTTTRSVLVRRDQFGNLQTIRSRLSSDISTDSLSAGLTWYVNRRLGLDLGYARLDADDGPDVDSYRVGGSWFVTENIYLGASIERTEVSLFTGQDDLDSATLKVGLRW